MATIASHLKMIDQFSGPLHRVTNQAQSAIASLERMRRLVERPMGDVRVRIDTSQVLHDAANLGSRISSQIGRIEADVQLNINAQLSGAMTNLDTSMERLRTEIEHLTQAIQNGGGPGGGNGGGPGGGGHGPGILGKFGKVLGAAAGVLGGAAVAGTALKGATQQQQLQGSLQAQVGIDENQAAAMMQQVQGIWAAGWGESLTTVSDDMAKVRQNLSGLSQEASAAYTQSAYAVEQIAKGETDIGELSKVTRTLMANFQGLSETKALDLITTGFQRGGNYAGDLLDTVNEYAVHFAGLGMSAEQMFATLIAGSEQGAWNLDKVGDAAKESFIRLQDLSDSSREGLQALGLDANKVAADIAAGGASANRAYQATLMALGKMDNALDRNTVGVKLFGTQWEDMEDSVILAMQEGQKGLGDFEGATAKVAEALQNNLGFQVEQFKRNFALGFAEAGQGSVEALMPLIKLLNEAFQDGKFQPFFDGLAAGLSFAAETIAMLVENALWLSDVISNNWSWIEPIIWGIVGALGAYLLLTQGMTVALWLANAAQAALNAIMNANPFVLIATLIIGVVTALITLWNTNDAFAAGLLRVWNGILNFFDQIPIFFTWVGNGIADAFDWAKVQSLKIVEQLANGVIDQINWVISQLNKIPGVSLETFDQLEISASAAAEAEAARQSRAAKLEGMKQNAVQKAAEREAKVQEFIKDRQDKRAKKEAEKAAQKNSKSAASGAAKAATKANIPGRVSTPKMPTIGVGDKDKNVAKVGKVGQVDKVKGKVDISSEDLKMMRELAEMKNIQNFVTIKPSVNFGDTHVRHESDIDTIVAHITEKLEQDIASSADAVYG